MWEMALTSMKLFLAGRLFQHPWSVVGKSAIGAGVTAALAFGLVALAGLPLVAVVGFSAFLGGLLQPYLFKDLKYR